MEYRIIRNNKVYTNELDISNQFNQHFNTIGPTLACAINPTCDDPTKYFLVLVLVLKFENVVKFKICSLAFKLYNNPSTVPAIFRNFLRPATTVRSYNTRSSTKLNFYRPQVRTNIGKFTFKYSASVKWETVPLALKKANAFNKFKKLYIAHLISCQLANICSF